MQAQPILLDAEVEALLEGVNLPVADLATRPSLQLLGVREGGRLVGVVGVEAWGDVGLLRSLAVTPACRRSGLGSRLASDAEAYAAGRGVGTLFLLTTTAADFFVRRGYEAVARCAAPAPIVATPQFQDLCPASSAFMRKAIGKPR
jgi:amino-acid N-acetyltransferase